MAEATVVVGIGDCGIEPDCLVEVPDGAIEVAAVQEMLAAPGMGFRPLPRAEAGAVENSCAGRNRPLSVATVARGPIRIRRGRDWRRVPRRPKPTHDLGERSGECFHALPLKCGNRRGATRRTSAHDWR